LVDNILNPKIKGSELIQFLSMGRQNVHKAIEFILKEMCQHVGDSSVQSTNLDVIAHTHTHAHTHIHTYTFPTHICSLFTGAAHQFITTAKLRAQSAPLQSKPRSHLPISYSFNLKNQAPYTVPDAHSGIQTQTTLLPVRTCAHACVIQ